MSSQNTADSDVTCGRASRTKEQYCDDAAQMISFINFTDLQLSDHFKRRVKIIWEKLHKTTLSMETKLTKRNSTIPYPPLVDN